MITVRVQTEPFDQGKEIEVFLNGQPDGGGLATFQGLVRGKDGSARIKSLTLEAYPAMTERVLCQYTRKARARFHLDACLVIHRYGRLLPGEPIVLVATHARHRQEAFDGACYLMDILKTRAPFWKYEDTDMGGRWVEQSNADRQAAKRWQIQD